MSSKVESYIFWAVFILLVSLRLLHFGESIDSPHAWRQCDSANVIWSFYTYGIDLLHPQVCWLGGHKNLVLEFPGVYGIIAFLYKIFAPSHIIARAVMLLFYAAGTIYFHKIIKSIGSKNLARVSTIIYLLVPLGLFFSRTIQIDFSAMFFVFGMTYHYLIGFNEKRFGQIALGSLFATFAFVTKVPYVLPVVFPLAFVVLRTGDPKLIFKSVSLLIIPIMAFAFWWLHGLNVNGSAPEWDFIPTYRKFTESAHWYFGTLQQRMWIGHWETIGTRLLIEVVGLSGVLFFISGVFLSFRGSTFFRLWFFGTLAYLAIFFNLNLIHNYYQIPFLIPASVFMAASLIKLNDLISMKSKSVGKAFVLVALAAIGTMNFSYAEANYYNAQPHLEKMGVIVQEHTDENDLIIFSYGGFDARCPLLLYRARRNGWSIPHHDLSAVIIYNLMLNGANHLAVISPFAPTGEVKVFTDFFEYKEIPLEGNDTLFLYQLDPQRLPPKPE
ncbi:MAG: hypothetical protein ACI9P8_000417 [Bacteroidia bacterium]|jgi:hypothetical protein